LKKFIAMFVVVLAALAATAPASAWDSEEKKVTICHAAGRAGTTHFETLTISENAVYKENGGHFYENGTPRAGHEQDYLGECVTTPPPPHDECPLIEGNQPEGYDCTPVTPPCQPDYNGEAEGCGTPPVVVVVTPPCVPQNPDGTPGGKDGKPGNDDCAKDEVPPTPPVVTPPVVTPPAVTPPVTPPATPEKPVVEKPKPNKPKTTPKPTEPKVTPDKPEATPPAATPVGETLPYTGKEDLWIVALIGVGLLGLGIFLRFFLRERA
jgi:LPXTG-motif cell wall-anchored protein